VGLEEDQVRDPVGLARVDQKVQALDQAQGPEAREDLVVHRCKRSVHGNVRELGLSLRHDGRKLSDSPKRQVKAQAALACFFHIR